MFLPLGETGQTVQGQGGGILGGKLGRGVCKRPTDADVGVVPQQGVLGWGVVVIGAAVVADNLTGKGVKAVGETFWNPQHTAVLRGKYRAVPLPESGRVAAQIHSHVKQTPVNGADEFALRVGKLVVQSAQYAALGMRQVVLYKLHGGDVLFKPCLAVGFAKAATAVAVNLGFKQQQVGQGGGDNVHDGVSVEWFAKQRARACCQSQGGMLKVRVILSLCRRD